jgi:hypothetical protein
MEYDESRYITLKRMYETLLQEHSKLKIEYSENFIIDSMNDMKKQFDIKERQLILLENDIVKIKDAGIYLSDTYKTITLIINTISSKLKPLDRSCFIEDDNYYRLSEIKSNLRFIDDIIKQAIKRKNELLYLT